MWVWIVQVHLYKKFFSIVNTTVYTICSWLNLRMWNWGFGRITYRISYDTNFQLTLVVQESAVLLMYIIHVNYTYNQPCLPFLIQDAPSPFWKQFQTWHTELCQKASWTVPWGMWGGGGRTDLILFQVKEAQVTFDRFHGPQWGCCPQDDAGIQRGDGGGWQMVTSSSLEVTVTTISPNQKSMRTLWQFVQS